MDAITILKPSRVFHEVDFLSSAPLSDEATHWTLVELPHDNSDIPCSQCVRHKWESCMALGVHSPSGLMSWQQQLDADPQLFSQTSQDWQDLSTKAANGIMPRCFQTARGEVLYKTALGLKPAGQELPLACSKWQVSTPFLSTRNHWQEGN